MEEKLNIIRVPQMGKSLTDFVPPHKCIPQERGGGPSLLVVGERVGLTDSVPPYRWPQLSSVRHSAQSVLCVFSDSFTNICVTLK